MYSIADLALMTGMTDRSLRNYLNAGFLRGEKVDGKWQFTPEQFEAFIQNEAVKPALQAKRNSAVFDFLADAKKQENAACVMLDATGENLMNISRFFCEAAGTREKVHMSFHKEHSHARVILTGPENDVLAVLGEYREQI